MTIGKRLYAGFGLILVILAILFLVNIFTGYFEKSARTSAGMGMIMITIRRELGKDAAAREALLDLGYGAVRFSKVSHRLREGRLPAAGLAFVACDHGRFIGTVRRVGIEPFKAAANAVRRATAVHA